MLEQTSSRTRTQVLQETITWRNPTDHKIYSMLKEKGPMTRPDLVERTGLPRSTLFDALTRLMIRGLIVRFSEERQTRGRPKVYYEVIA
jgi:predicted transcriptional regulator